jgi:uncharacterized C2H2 Zn-finger protein
MPLELLDRTDGIGLVTCPNCQVTMRCVFLKPVEGEAELREAAYRCPRCDAETTRWIRP